jgi:hypothetical protein
MSEITDFYRRPGLLSGLGRHRQIVSGLPAGAEALSAIVRGLLVHNLDAQNRGLRFSAERMSHMQAVGAEAILDNVLGLDPAPVGVKRPVKQRMVGYCYHFALLHCALMRATGTPARARCGFAGYFEPGRWIDHWVTEYWDDAGWRLTDPEIGRDLARGEFRDGPTAWSQCRAGAAAPAAHGNRELWGWDELRGSLVNDVGALNKVEVSGWSWCGRIKAEPPDQPHDDLDAWLDPLARRAAAADSVETVKQCFDPYPELQPPADATAW